MKHKPLYLITGLLATTLLGGLSSCSKSDSQVEPTPVSSPAADVQVADGHLVFKDFQTFKQTLDLLKAKQEGELSAWEGTLHFASLRASKAEAASSLKEEFRFPAAYMAILNPQGEFQIGSKSYWFHAGQKLAFNSTADMKAAEAGQTVPFTATAAGYKLIAPKASAGTAAGTGSAARILNSVSGVDARYQYQFNLWNDAGSVRKTVYETYVFTDYYSDIHQFHSVLAMNLKLEFRRSNGSWGVAGETRNIDVSFSGVASAYTSATLAQLTTGTIGVQETKQSNSNTTYWLKDVWAFEANVATPSDIYWDFTINGRLNSWVSSDPAHAYPVQGYPLWQ